MTEFEHNAGEFEVKPATDLTVATLLGLIEEFALRGEENENNGSNAIVFGNETIIGEDKRKLYVARYIEPEGNEMPVNEKLGELLFEDLKTEKATTSQLPEEFPSYDFTNYYIVNAGEDKCGSPSYRLEKHRLQVTSQQLGVILQNNHRTNTPEYEFENSLGLRSVSEDEAIELIKLLMEKSEVEI